MATVTRTVQHDTIDRICWRHYGTTIGTVEAVLKANPRLCEYPPHLPEGVLITLPLLVTSSETIEVIRLWD